MTGRCTGAAAAKARSASIFDHIDNDTATTGKGWQVYEGFDMSSSSWGKDTDLSTKCTTRKGWHEGFDLLDDVQIVLTSDTDNMRVYPVQEPAAAKAKTSSIFDVKDNDTATTTRGATTWFSLRAGGSPRSAFRAGNSVSPKPHSQGEAPGERIRSPRETGSQRKCRGFRRGTI